MVLNAIIEMPKGTDVKYEFDKNSGLLKVDRLLKIPIPYNYGYIPGTISPDGDDLDVFVLSLSSIYPLSLVSVEPKFVVKGIDNGVSDDKLICTIVGDSSFDGMELNCCDVIKRYLAEYKEGFEIQDIIPAEGYKIPWRFELPS
jgi:inorganic pyrophosphatase